MKSNPENSKPQRERQDWGIVLIIILFGFLCVILSAQWALRFAPSWQVKADMGSNIDLNREFLANEPAGFIEPVDPGILTQPGWANFLTPGAKVVTRTPLPAGLANVVPTQVQETAAAPVTNTIPVFNTIAPTNTLVWLPLPATATRKPKDPPADTPTDTPVPSASLTITNSDGATLYLPGSTRSYEIIVSNLTGPSNVIGATVTNTLSGPIFNASWSCLAAGTTCGAGGAGGNINDVVDLPVGSSITYTVNVTIDNPAAGDLVNTASVSLPLGYGGPSPLTLIDTDAVINAGAPPGGIGTYDSGCDLLNAGDPPILFSVPAAIDDDGTPDLIYYEELSGGGILMDKVVIEISDGLNWYTLLNWGDDAQNNNTTNLLLPIVGSCDWVELDNCQIAGGTLENNTGVLLNIPASLQDGLTSYIRITVLSPEDPPDDGNVCIDALVPYP